MQWGATLRAYGESFYSKPLYRKVARRWKGAALGYLLLLLAICLLPEALKMQVEISRFARQEGAALARQIPDITIRQGEVSTDVATPYFIKDRDGAPLAIIDLTGRYTSLDHTPARFLLTRNRLIYRRRGRIKANDLSNVQNFHLNRARAERWLGVARKWLVPTLFPLGLAFVFLYRIIQALVYALIGVLLARPLKVSLDYLTLLRLAIVAVTPAIIVDTLHSALNLRTALWGPICFLIAMGYLLFALRCNTPQVDDYPAPPSAIRDFSWRSQGN